MIIIKIIIIIIKDMKKKRSKKIKQQQSLGALPRRVEGGSQVHADKSLGLPGSLQVNFEWFEGYYNYQQCSRVFVQTI